MHIAQYVVDCWLINIRWFVVVVWFGYPAYIPTLPRVPRREGEKSISPTDDRHHTCYPPPHNLDLGFLSVKEFSN